MQLAPRRWRIAAPKEMVMIDFYTCATPNGQKIHIMLEETGLEYSEHWIDIDKGDQFAPEFLAISPNNKIPAILDDDGPGSAPLSLFESGAILLYLARKTGKFLPEEPGKHWDVMQCSLMRFTRCQRALLDNKQALQDRIEQLEEAQQRTLDSE